MSQLLGKVVKNTFWVGSSSIATGILGFVITTFTVKLMGLPQSGFAVAVVSIVGILSALGSLGVTSGLVYQISQRRSDADFYHARESLESAMTMSLIIGLFSACAMWIWSERIVDMSKWTGSLGEAKTFCVLTGFTFCMANLGAPHQAALEGALRYDLRARIVVSSLAFQAFATIVLLWRWPSLIVLASINLAISSFRTIAFGWASARVLGFIARPRWSSVAFGGLWRYSRWIYFGTLFNVGFAGFDRMILMSQFGSVLLPVYVLARRFYEIAHEMLTSQTGYFVPIISTIYKSSSGAPSDVEDRLRWFVASLAAWLYVGILLIGPTLLGISVSPEFAADARVPLLIVVLVGFMHAQAIVPFYFAQAQGSPVWGFGLSATCALTVVPAMMFLGSFVGFIGAVAGQLMIGICSIVFVMLRCRTAGNPKLAQVWAPIACPSVLFVMAVVVYLVWFMVPLPLVSLCGVGTVFLLSFFPILCRMEGRDSRRVATLHRAVVIAEMRAGPLAPIVRKLMSYTFGAPAPQVQDSQ